MIGPGECIGENRLKTFYKTQILKSVKKCLKIYRTSDFNDISLASIKYLLSFSSLGILTKETNYKLDY